MTITHYQKIEPNNLFFLRFNSIISGDKEFNVISFRKALDCTFFSAHNGKNRQSTRIEYHRFHQPQTTAFDVVVTSRIWLSQKVERSA